jgi:hypothetical protein
MGDFKYPNICHKTMERIVRDKMMQYLTENNLINVNQHGFVNNFIRSHGLYYKLNC